MARRYEFYFRVAKQYFTNERSAANYVIDKLTCEIMENKPLVSRMYFYECYEWYIFQ